MKEIFMNKVFVFFVGLIFIFGFSINAFAVDPTTKTIPASASVSDPNSTEFINPPDPSAIPETNLLGTNLHTLPAKDKTHYQDVPKTNEAGQMVIFEDEYQQFDEYINLQKERQSKGYVCSDISLGAGIVAGAVAMNSTGSQTTENVALVISGLSAIAFWCGVYVIIDSGNCVVSAMDNKINLLHDHLKRQGLLNMNSSNKISFSIPQIEFTNDKVTTTIASMPF
jgi:hypothetical protein